MFDRHERAVSDRTRFMLHDEPKGTDVDHAVRLLVALDYHALPGQLHFNRYPLTFNTTPLGIFRLPSLWAQVEV